MGQLDYNNWMNCNLLHILEDNNITETHQKGVDECRWYTAKDTSFTNASRTSHNGDEFTVNTKGNACGVTVTNVK